MNNKQLWIIGIGGSDMDGIVFRTFFGDASEAREALFSICLDDRREIEDLEWFDYGTESAEDVQELYNGNELYAYNCFNNLHRDYTARKMTAVQHFEI